MFFLKQLVCIGWFWVVWVSIVVGFGRMDSVLAQSGSGTTKSASARSDSVETKIRLLQTALERQDFDLARALTHSMRESIIQLQHELEPLPTSIIPKDDWQAVAAMPVAWQTWAAPWRYYKRLLLEESAGLDRNQEPVELAIDFQRDKCIPIARVTSGGCRTDRPAHRGLLSDLA